MNAATPALDARLAPAPQAAAAAPFERTPNMKDRMETLLATVFGGIFLVYVASGLVAGGVPFTWTQVINGAVLVATVSLSTFLRRR